MNKIGTCQCGSEYVFLDYHTGNRSLCHRCRHSNKLLKDIYPPDDFQQMRNRALAWQAFVATQEMKTEQFLCDIGDGNATRGMFLLSKLFEWGLVNVTMSHEEMLVVNEEWKRREEPA